MKLTGWMTRFLPYPLSCFRADVGERLFAIFAAPFAVVPNAVFLLWQKQADISSELLAYVNRLSDYLFVLSRKMNQDEKKEEIFWNNSCK